MSIPWDLQKLTAEGGGMLVLGGVTNIYQVTAIKWGLILAIKNLWIQAMCEVHITIHIESYSFQTWRAQNRAIMARLVENWLHTTEKMGIIVLKLGNCWTLSVGHFPWLVGDPAILFSRIGVFRVRYRTLCNCSLISASLSISLKSFSMPVFSWWFVEVSPIAGIFSSTQMICFFLSCWW